MSHEEDGFSHHCPKCNHHNPTMCVVAGQVKGWKERAEKAERDLRRLQENVEAGIFVNATPDAEYPIRILQGHLAPNESSFITDNLLGIDPKNPVIVEMNKASAERAKILRAAIAKLKP